MPGTPLKFVKRIIANPEFTPFIERENRSPAIIHPRPVPVVQPSRKTQPRNATARTHPNSPIRSNTNIDHIVIGQSLALCKNSPLSARISKSSASRRTNPHRSISCKANHLHPIGRQPILSCKCFPSSRIIPLKPTLIRAKPERAIVTLRHRQHRHIAQTVHICYRCPLARIHIQ